MFLLARAWTNNDGLSKVRHSLWFGKGIQQLVLFSCRRDSQSRKTTLAKLCSFSKPEATCALLYRDTIWKLSGLPIRGVFSFLETPGNKTFARPRARPERVRFGSAPENGPFRTGSAARASNNKLILTNVAASSRGATARSYV